MNELASGKSACCAAVERDGGGHAGRDPDRALSAHRGIRPLDSVRRPCARAGRALRLRHRSLEQTGAAPRPCRGGRGFCHRRGRFAGAGVDVRARQRLAHRRPGADGAGHRLDLRATAAAGAALSGGKRDRAGAAARRLRAAHRRQRHRHHADLQLAALWLWRAGGLVLVCRLPAAQARRRCTGAHGRFSGDPVHRSCSRSWKSATT